MLNSDPADTKTEYAFWADPQAGYRVEYSLPLFHELDFQVNEGYRRIPHGGIEIGGVLWGRVSGKTLIIEAFRQIACEHASGPSFNLSAADLVGLETLIASGPNSEDLRELTPLGWFIAHTRGPLQITDRERELFRQYFPGPGKLTLLIKPERFQPTRFGFLLRRSDGTVPADATDLAVILPLPGRAGKGVMASIPAPSRKNDSIPPPVGEKKPEPLPLERSERPKERGAGEVIVMTPSSGLPVPPATNAIDAAATTLTAAKPISTPAKSAPEPVPLAKQATTPFIPEAKPKRTEQFRGIQEPDAPKYDLTSPKSRLSAWQWVALFLLSAVLGGALGYWSYLKLPSPTIDLRAQKLGSDLLVQWPAEQTREVDYAAYRVNDGPSQLLTLTQRLSGQLTLPAAGGDTKVEVIAQHWFRDSHGYVRFLTAPADPGHADTKSQ